MGQDKKTSEHEVKNEKMITEVPTLFSCDYCDHRCITGSIITESIITLQKGVKEIELKLLQDQELLTEALTKLRQGKAA